jgi:hypothetical protein
MRLWVLEKKENAKPATMQPGFRNQMVSFARSQCVIVVWDNGEQVSGWIPRRAGMSIHNGSREAIRDGLLVRRMHVRAIPAEVPGDDQMHAGQAFRGA